MYTVRTPIENGRITVTKATDILLRDLDQDGVLRLTLNDAGKRNALSLAVTSREVVRVFLKQLWSQFVPVFHGLQGRSTMKN